MTGRTLTNQAMLGAALDALWAQYLPQMEERVSTLESAAKTLVQRELADAERIAANSAAHKLAGVLGTFGLTKGTVLAREAEILYSREQGAERADAERLAEIAAQIKTMIAGRK